MSSISISNIKIGNNIQEPVNISTKTQIDCKFSLKIKTEQNSTLIFAKIQPKQCINVSTSKSSINYVEGAVSSYEKVKKDIGLNFMHRKRHYPRRLSGSD